MNRTMRHATFILAEISDELDQTLSGIIGVVVHFLLDLVPCHDPFRRRDRLSVVIFFDHGIDGW